MRSGNEAVKTITPDKMPLSIVNVKKSIVDNILMAVVIIGALLVIVTTIRDLQVKIDVSNAIANGTVLALLLLQVVFRKKIDYQTKTWVIIAAFTFMGIKATLINGTAEASFNFFLFASLVAILILKPQKALYIIIVTSALFILITGLFAFNLIHPVIPSVAAVNPKVVWVSRIFMYLFLLFIVIGGVGRLQKSFMTSIEELDESNQKLNQYNEELRNQLEYSTAMEQKVNEKEINFKTLFEESNDGIIVCDADGTILEANQAIASMLSYPKSFLIGNSSADFVISDDKRAIHQLSIDKIHRSKLRELYVLGKDGNRIPVEVNYSVITFNYRKSILVTVRDIRERKDTEEKVLNAVIQAEENERSRFAKDLHDDLGPIMSSIKMYIQSLRQHADSEDKKELINRLITTVDDSIKSIRKISHNLSSHLLQNMGLINALKTHVERINLSGVFNIQFNHNFAETHRLASNIEIVTYRVLLELITNSVTHSRGNEINIDLALVENQFVIHYSDNGTGFDIDKILHDNSKGIGLRNIMSRVKSIKGLLNFEGDKSGFSLTIDINL
jgi:PAS domain S-box-containing protein